MATTSKHTRRHLVLAGSASAISMSCAPRAADDRKGATQLKSGITLQWGIASGQSRVELRTKQVEMFEREFPGIKVELVVGGSDVNKIKAGIAAGTPYDLIRITTTQYAGFAHQGAVIALDSLIKRDRYDLKDFFPAAITQWQWRGKQWAMPFLGVLTAYVNTELVEQSGARRAPTTWHDRTWDMNAFLEFCKKTTRQAGGRTVQWGFSGTHNNWRYYMPWLWANGGEMFDRDLTRVAFSDPPAQEGLQFLADLINRHRVAPHPDELPELGGTEKPFRDGKVAIMAASVNAIAANRQVPGLRWTLTAYPRGSKGIAMGGGGVGWFITTGSRYPDETWELLKVVLSPDSDKLTALMGEAPPSRRSVGRDPEFLNPKEAPGADTKVIVETLESALRTDPVLIQGEEIFKIFADELGPLWAGRRSAREAADIIQGRVRPMLAMERQ